MDALIESIIRIAEDGADSPLFNQEWPGILFQSRARILTSLRAAECLKNELKRLLEGTTKYYAKLGDAGVDPTGFWDGLATELSDMPQPAVICEEVNSQLPPAVAFFAIVDQVNWFKHHTAGAAQPRRPSESRLPDRAGDLSLVQWAATLRALAFARRFAESAACVAARSGAAEDPVRLTTRAGL